MQGCGRDQGVRAWLHRNVTRISRAVWPTALIGCFVQRCSIKPVQPSSAAEETLSDLSARVLRRPAEGPNQG